MKKVKTEYSEQLKASEYDFLKLEVNEESKQIKIEFLDSRWRTPQETIEVLKEIIAIISENF